MFWKLLFGIALMVSLNLGGSSLVSAEDIFLASKDADKKTKIVSRLILGKSTNPDYIYDSVWMLIKEDFYDDSFNGQDWDRWRHRYDGKLADLDDAHKAVETMLASLGDRYTRFLDKDAFSEEKSQIKAELCGIGVQIGINKEKKIIVIRPIPGTPAYKAGIEAGDLINKIDGKSTKDFTVDDAAKLIRGPINSKVKLTILRSGKSKAVSIVRGKIPLRSVQSVELLERKIGYIRLTSFISRKTDEEMKDAVKKLSGAKGLVLDLRDNPGGLLNQAIKVSNLFLDDGYIVSTVDRDGYKTSVKVKGDSICNLPLIVLINKGSASASEITSGALKDNNRATLVGEQTFGKGLVQGINRLDDGSGVNITIARYLTPNDVDINKKGITPDVAIKLSKSQYKEHHGPWWMDEPKAKRKASDMKDLQLKKAVDLLKGQIAGKGSIAMRRASKIK